MFIKSLLIAAILPFLAHTLPMNPPNEWEISAFVERCFYDVGVQKWMAEPDNECKQMTANLDLNSIKYNADYKAVFESLRRVMIAQHYRRVIREQQHEMQVTMECANHMRIPYGFTAETYMPRECETLWYGETRLSHNKSDADIQALKQARRMAKYLAQLNWVPNSPEAAEDKKVALECFHAVQATCPPKSVCLVESCLGITWGKSVVNAKRTQLRMDYFKQLQVIRPVALPEPEYVNATGSFVVKELVALASVDHELVTENKQDLYDYFECFYHENFLLVDECQGIRFKRPKKITTLRQAHLVSLWTEIAQFVMYFPTAMPEVKAVVEKKRAVEVPFLKKQAEKKRMEAEATQKVEHDLQIARELLQRRIFHLNAEFMRYWSHTMQ